MITNAAAAFVFAAFFAYTFFGRQHIESMAREFVTAKTQILVTPAVDTAEQALRSGATRRFLTQKQVAALEGEIAEFREQPTQYIQRLTSAHAPPPPKTLVAAVSEKVAGWKERIRMHYNRVLGRLFTDLRIFSGSNVSAACLAFSCAWRSPRRPAMQLTLISALLLIAIGLSVYLYIDDFSFFTMLFNSYLGWWYPCLPGLLFLTMYFDYGSHRSAKVA